MKPKKFFWQNTQSLIITREQARKLLAGAGGLIGRWQVKAMCG